MPKSRYYQVQDIIHLVEKTIEIAQVDSSIKLQSRRKYYQLITDFVNKRADRAKGNQLPNDYHLIKDYRFFINHYENHLERIKREDNNDFLVTATTSYINTLSRCTGVILSPQLRPEKKKTITTNDLVDKWTLIFRRQNDLKGYNTTAEIKHSHKGKEITLELKKKLYAGTLQRQQGYFIAIIKDKDVDIVIRINKDDIEKSTFFTGTFMGKLPVYNQYPSGEIFMIRES
jgi:hypothetical protein